MSRTAAALSVLLAAAVVAPPSLDAQACVGLPNGVGEVAAAASFRVDDTGAPGDTAAGTSIGLGGVGGEAGYHPPGSPASVRAGYAVVNVDSLSEDAERAEGAVMVELGGGTSSICAVGGLARETVGGPAGGVGSFDQTVWEIPVGVGVSRTIQPAGSITVAPFLFPHAVYRDVEVERTLADSTTTAADSDYSGRATFGVVVSGSTFWARLSSGVDVPVGESAELRPLGAVTFGLLF